MCLQLKRWPLALLLSWLMAFNAMVGAADSADVSTVDLAQMLKQGGYLLYFRHSLTDHSKDDNHPVDFDGCATQRNLSEQGRNQAKSIGEHMRRLGIPVGEVLSSPYCRCRDTAQLAFGRHQVDKDLYFAISAGPEERRRITRALQLKLSETPAAGTNNVIVSHTANLREATGIWPKPEGVAWVIEPDGAGGYKALGKIAPTDWQRLE
jgi:phosphohistidine phosphatase SixA